jgi:molybdopterin-guanine dinucleotide biosynthesis protein A
MIEDTNPGNQAAIAGLYAALAKAQGEFATMAAQIAAISKLRKKR